MVVLLCQSAYIAFADVAKTPTSAVLERQTSAARIIEGLCRWSPAPEASQFVEKIIILV
jgi:hypothetical protein